MFYAQRRIKGEKQREQNRLAEKKKFDRSLIDKAKQELRAFLGNQNAGSEVVARPAITNASSNRSEENEVQGSQDDEVQARLDQLLDEVFTTREPGDELEAQRRDSVQRYEAFLDFWATKLRRNYV